MVPALAGNSCGRIKFSVLCILSVRCARFSSPETPTTRTLQTAQISPISSLEKVIPFSVHIRVWITLFRFVLAFSRFSQ